MRNKNGYKFFYGEWKDNIKEGHGYEKYTEGDEYFGQFKNDKMHGQGIL